MTSFTCFIVDVVCCYFLFVGMLYLFSSPMSVNLIDTVIALNSMTVSVWFELASKHSNIGPRLDCSNAKFLFLTCFWVWIFPEYPGILTSDSVHCR